MKLSRACVLVCARACLCVCVRARKCVRACVDEDLSDVRGMVNESEKQPQQHLQRRHHRRCERHSRNVIRVLQSLHASRMLVGHFSVSWGHFARYSGNVIIALCVCVCV